MVLSSSRFLFLLFVLYFHPNQLNFYISKVPSVYYHSNITMKINVDVDNLCDQTTTIKLRKQHHISSIHVDRLIQGIS